MLVCLWSPKGGSGTSVTAAVAALVLARDGAARLGDVGGDQPAILGLSAEPSTGLRDWLQVGVEAPTDALDRLALDAGSGLTLLPAGDARVDAAPAEAGAALGTALRSAGVPTIVDVGVPSVPALEALVEVADASVVVLRGCYLALRRAVRMAPTTATTGAVVLREPGRALGAREVGDVLGVPVLTTIDVRVSNARVVDAGVLVARMPDPLVRPVRTLLARLGVRREGEAA